MSEKVFEMSDTDNIAIFAELLDKKIEKLEKSSAELLDRKIDKLENTLVEKVTLAVSEKVCDTVTKRVDDQMEAVLAPFIEEQESYKAKTDSTLSELKKQISDLVGSVKNQPNNVFAPLNFPTLSTTLVPPPTLPKPPPATEGAGAVTATASGSAIVNIVSNAKCVVGIAPVSPVHVEEQGASSHEEGLLKAALDYLRKELNIRDSEINEDDIDSIFLPANCSRDSFTKVYV